MANPGQNQVFLVLSVKNVSAVPFISAILRFSGGVFALSPQQAQSSSHGSESSPKGPLPGGISRPSSVARCSIPGILAFCCAQLCTHILEFLPSEHVWIFNPRFFYERFKYQFISYMCICHSFKSHLKREKTNQTLVCPLKWSITEAISLWPFLLL